MSALSIDSTLNRGSEHSERIQDQYSRQPHCWLTVPHLTQSLPKCTNGVREQLDRKQSSRKERTRPHDSATEYVKRIDYVAIVVDYVSVTENIAQFCGAEKQSRNLDSRYHR